MRSTDLLVPLLVCTTLAGCASSDEEPGAGPDAGVSPARGTPFVIELGGARVDYLAKLAPIDGGYVLAGSSTTFTPDPLYEDMWISMVDAAETPALRWSRFLGFATWNDAAKAVVATGAADVAFTGMFQTQPPESGSAYASIVGVLDRRDGHTVWQRGVSAGPITALRALSRSAGGVLIAAGGVTTGGGTSMLVIGMSEEGELLWSRSAALSGFTSVEAAFPQGDGTTLLATADALDGSPAVETDVWAIHLDDAGEVAWQRRLGGPGAEAVFGGSPTRDGGALVAGWTTSFGAAKTDGWVLKLGADGAIAWQTRLASDDAEELHAVVETEDGGVAVAGLVGSYLLGKDRTIVAKLSGDGREIRWQERFTGGTNGRAVGLVEEPGGDLVVAATLGTEVPVEGAGQSDRQALLMRLASDGSLAEACAAIEPTAFALGASDADGAATAIELTEGDVFVDDTIALGAGDAPTAFGDTCE